MTPSWYINQTVPGFNCGGSVCVHVSAVPLRGTKKNKTQKKPNIFRQQPSPDDFLSSLPPFCPCVFLSSLSVLLPSSPSPSPSSFSPPSLLDWWSKHRKSAGSVPPRQSWRWAFLQSSCTGVKSLLWFSFHLSSANHRATQTRLNSDPCKEFHSKDGLTPVSQLHPPPIAQFSPYYSFSFLSTGQFYVLTELR